MASGPLRFGATDHRERRPDRRRLVARNQDPARIRPEDLHATVDIDRAKIDRAKIGQAKIGRAKIDATTEEDIRRRAIEDGENPDVEPAGDRHPGGAARRERSVS